MIIYSIGRRIKNFFKVTVTTYDIKKKKEKIISGEEYLRNNLTMSEGKVRWFYEDGNLKSECKYEDSMLEGISIHYYKNGTVKAKETYKKNKQDGLTIRYNEKGKIISEETYKSGNLISKIVYDSEGNKTDEKSS